ncbi:UNVERIFIED_ORG: hypothetical protein ABID57_001321 [Arthrobacter sp. UYEF1]
MSWRVWACDTKTGQKLAILPAESFPWTNVLNGAGQGSAGFQLGVPFVGAGFPWRDLCEPIKRTLVIEWDGSPVYAGILWDWNYDHDARTLSVNHADIWSILSKRLVSALNAAGIEATKVEHASYSLWRLARASVEAGTSGGANFALPIFYQGWTGGGESRTYHGYHLPRVLESLQAIMNTDGGPDVVFDPRWSTDGSKLEYLMRDGVDTSPGLEYNLSAPRKEIFGVKVTRDANNVANVVIGTGEGTEVKLTTRSATDPATPYPAIVKTVAFGTEPDLGVLQRNTDAELVASKAPVEQWSAKIHASADQRVTLLKLGRRVRFYSKGDPMIPDGYHTHRIIQYSGDLADVVSLEFQAVGG